MTPLELMIRAMHLTQVAQVVVAGSWQSIPARCSSFAIGSRTMRRAGSISPGCGGRKGSAARCAGGRIIGSRRGVCVTAGGCGRQTSVTAGTSLEPAIAAAIERGSQVRTDDWKGYSGLDRLGYRRQIVRSSAEVGENLLPLANRVASLLKRWLLGTHQGAVSAAHLDYYLDEYTFRFNRRTSGSRGLLFLRLMQQAVDLSPVPTKELLGGRRLRKNSTN